MPDERLTTEDRAELERLAREQSLQSWMSEDLTRIGDYAVRAIADLRAAEARADEWQAAHHELMRDHTDMTNAADCYLRERDEERQRRESAEARERELAAAVREEREARFSYDTSRHLRHPGTEGDALRWRNAEKRLDAALAAADQDGGAEAGGAR